MEVLALSHPRRLAARALLLALVAGAIAIAAYGATQIPGTLGSQSAKPASASGLTHKPIFSIRDSAPMSFGALQVVDASVATGLTNQQLGGMSHGISGLIGADTAQLQVSMEMTNSTYAPTPWTAADFRVVAARSGREFAPVGGTKESGELAPGASLDLVLNYVVPRNGDHFTLSVRDGQSLVRVHLIQVGKAPPGTKGLHDEHGTGVAPKREGTKS